MTGTRAPFSARLRSLKLFAGLLAVMVTVSGSALVFAAATAPPASAGVPGWAIQATANPAGVLA